VSDGNGEIADAQTGDEFKEKQIMENIESAKERLAAIERMKRGMTVGTQTTMSDKSSSEVYNNAAFTVKFDAEGLPTLTASSSSSVSSSAALVFLLPCLRRSMLCYSGQKAVLLPPHLFLAYFQEILHFRLRFPVRPDCSSSEAGGGSSAKSGAVSASVASSSLSLQATVASMRQKRRNSAITTQNTSLPSALLSIPSDAYSSAHKCVKTSWCSAAAAYDGFSPAMGAFPDYALRFFQAVFGQKASADIM
jgi:hypothetical protein